MDRSMEKPYKSRAVNWSVNRSHLQASIFPHAPHSNQIIKPTERTLKTQVSKKALKEELSAVKEAQL